MSLARKLTSRPAYRQLGHRAVAVLLIGVLAPAAPASAASAGGGAGTASAGRLGSVPDTAFLQPEDTGGPVGWRPDDDLHPPLPCGQYPSQRLRRAEGVMAYDLPTEDFHTILAEYLTAYRGAGATRYLAELSRAIGRHGCADQTGEWTVIRAGGDSLTIRLRQKIEDYGGNPTIQDSYLAVARTGRIVVVLHDVGWEDGSSDPDTVHGLIAAAIRRARAATTLPARYRAIPLGFGEPGTRTWATAMNDRGQVVGQWEIAPDVVRPFRWQNGRVVVLGTLESGPGASGGAQDINARGDIVGGSTVGDTRHATLWRRDGRIIDLGTLGGRYSSATAINDDGVIVGNSEIASGELRPFLWRNGRMRELGLTGLSVATDINNRGQVVGSSGFGSGAIVFAYLWRSGRVSKLPSPDAHDTVANAINDRGEIVGSLIDHNFVSHAVRWDRGKIGHLGALAGGNASSATDINDRGLVVGTGPIQPDSIVDHPFVSWRGLLWDLTRMGLPETEGSYLVDVDNRGRLLGRNTVYTPIQPYGW